MIITADKVTAWYQVSDVEHAYLSLENNFGGGYVKVEKYISESAFPLREADTNIPYMFRKAGNYRLPEANPGDLIRIELVDSTSPSLYVKFSGCIKTGS